MKYKDIEIENNRVITKLNKENYRIYDILSIYLNLDEEIDKTKILIKNDIVNMLYDGQVRGQSWEEVIGKDYKKFADEIKNNRKKDIGKSSVLYYLYNIFLIIFVTLIINLFFKLDDGIGENIIVGSEWLMMVLIIIPYLYLYNKFATRIKKGGFIGFLLMFLILLPINLLDNFVLFEIKINVKLYFIAIILSIILFIYFHRAYKKNLNDLLSGNK
ncbi:hypothetical protein [Miniphocaeibacter halophilus]|uniref:Uncharacterized protein n=1 Tax=Miniphocaeibacter halophilus TaxID=2931922 RepID=A0AC61MT58_9FIRM|nr:hypothetical protein [Miniphocaeibacter halophilus]QQK08797.1 hypothetical protein JFY71_04495 [Miniphocaeibacter halophilus]